MQIILSILIGKLANKSYIYNIFPSTINEIGEPLETSELTTDYYGWFLIDEETGTCYEFNLNTQSGEIQTETDFTEYKNYTKYPGFSIGDRKYIRGTVSAIVGEITVDGKLDQTTDYLDGLRDFILNGKEKLLKNPKGHGHRAD
jgi:hypothetical protein